MKIEKVKLIFTVVLLLAVIGKSPAQTQSSIISPDIRLFDCFEKAYIELLKSNNPDLIVYYNFYLDNSYFIAELPAEKSNSAKIEKLKFQDKFKNSKTNISELNILKYDVKRFYDEYSFYSIGTTNKVVVFYSEKEFMIKYNEYRNSLGLLVD